MKALVYAAIMGMCTLGHGKMAVEEFEPTLINGVQVPTGSWKEVVYISMGGGFCSATFVGPRVIVTAGHCATTGEKATFSYKGKSYTATMTQSSLYKTKNHDVSIGLLSQDVPGVSPKTIGGTSTRGQELTLLGYGCTNAHMDATGRWVTDGGNDGILRIGKTVITSNNGLDMMSKARSGAVLCPGDSGGPAFIAPDGEENALLVGINSAVDFAGQMNINSRLDTTESQSFLKNFASSKGVSICGINKQCTAVDPDPVDPDPVDPDDPTPDGPGPSCTLTANPQSIGLGESVTLTLKSKNANQADIDGYDVSIPTGTRTLTPRKAGNFSIQGHVYSSSGDGSCLAKFTVKDTPTPDDKLPTCTLTASADVITLGDTYSLEIVVAGQATSATIDGVAVAKTGGRRVLTATSTGKKTSKGVVTGTGGSNSCTASYQIVDGDTPPGPGPDPETPAAYGITPVNCGNNQYPTSGVTKVCTGVVKKANTSEKLKTDTVILITHSDGEVETLPVISTRALASANTSQIQEEWVLYVNRTNPDQKAPALDTRSSTAVKDSTSGNMVSLTGRSGRNNRYFSAKLK